ncbi:MAG: hypothetical protein EOP49_24605 [Sphingobacteriales bacterium]|nr:MAG: hypothetical protein EOP49_24605 [Sphingobacteriales bacterium]
MKKILMAAAMLASVCASTADATAALIVTYAGQSKLTPILAGDNLWRLDCLEASKDCCTVNWDRGTVLVYALTLPPEGVTPDRDGNVSGTFENLRENPNAELSVTMDISIDNQ